MFPGVNFINVKHTNFSYKMSFRQLLLCTCNQKKPPKRHSYEKFVRLTLMKLTAGLKTNMFILQPFLSIFLSSPFLIPFPLFSFQSIYIFLPSLSILLTIFFKLLFSLFALIIFVYLSLSFFLSTLYPSIPPISIIFHLLFSLSAFLSP